MSSVPITFVGAGTSQTTSPYDLTQGTLQNQSGNLQILIAFFGSLGSFNPSPPTGWTLAGKVDLTSCPMYIYYLFSTGQTSFTFGWSNAAPIDLRVLEFSGVPSGPSVETGNATGTPPTSSLTATATGVDVVSGSLIITAANGAYSPARSPNLTFTSNNASSFTLQANNNGTSATIHYSSAYSSLTTSNASATNSIVAYSTTSGQNTAYNLLVTFAPSQYNVAQAQTSILTYANLRPISDITTANWQRLG